LLKIIIDSNIPYIQGVLDRVAEVRYLTHQEINADTVRDADALIVRTRTKCNASLLNGSKVKFIASATIGFDHIDAEYCRKNGITWTNAPGCNALSVAQYMASVFSFLKNNFFDLSGKTLGVVGVGAVGSKIARLGNCFGMNVLQNDPPRARKEGAASFVSLAEICEESDIITFHTPLNLEGEDKTFHLADEKFFDRLGKKPVMVNAARGEVVSTEALMKAIENGKVLASVIDCWENEPNIDGRLLEKAALTTPHIAGYSAEGKANAASQCVQAVSKFFGLGLDNWHVENLPAPSDIDLTSVSTPEEFFLKTYNIVAESNQLKSSPHLFEYQRSHYPFRREPSAYLSQLKEDFQKKLTVQFPLFFK
jgi:erythronate-4-phosphate dehydrogenase